MKVALNGVNYELLEGTGVKRAPLQEWANQIRTDGQQQRKDRVFISTWSIDDWAKGLGIEEIKVGSTQNLRRLWDAENVDTRFDQIVLSPAFNTCTIVPSRGDLKLAMDYGADLYFIETERVGYNGGIVAYAHQYSPPSTIGSSTHLAYTRATATLIGSVSAVKAFGKTIHAVAHGQRFVTDIHDTINELGGTLSSVDGRPLGQTSKAIRPQIGDFGGTMHLLHYDSALNQAKMYLSGGGLVASVPVASLYANVGTYLAPMVTDGLTMWAKLPQALYDFDNTPAVVVDTTRAQDRNSMQTFMGNKLLFKNKMSVISYDGSALDNMGYDRNDGLVTEKMGEITAMVSSWKWAFAAVQGLTYSHILAYDNAEDAWQYYARVPSPGLWVRELKLSNSPDAIDRLWVLYGNYNYPGYFLNPMVNPLQAATYSFVPTGQVTFPNYGGDMPEVGGAFYQIKYNLSGMGGSNIITTQYGINGANAVTTLGVVATSNLTHVLGSPYGIAGNRIQPKFILAGANSGTTPIFKQAVVEYLKEPDKRSLFDFSIDIDKSVQYGQFSREAIIGSLNYSLSQKTLMPFWYGQMGTRNVKALDMPFTEDVKNQIPLEQQREGIVQVRLVEVL